MHSFRNEFFTCLFKIQNVQVIQNDVIKCCKMMSSNVAKWCHHIATSQQRGEIVFHVVIFGYSGSLHTAAHYTVIHDKFQYLGGRHSGLVKLKVSKFPREDPILWGGGRKGGYYGMVIAEVCKSSIWSSKSSSRGGVYTGVKNREGVTIFFSH